MEAFSSAASYTTDSQIQMHHFQTASLGEKRDSDMLTCDVHSMNHGSKLVRIFFFFFYVYKGV